MLRGQFTGIAVVQNQTLAPTTSMVDLDPRNEDEYRVQLEGETMTVRLREDSR